MPGPVDKYFKEVKDANPSYSDEQAWATAWSIYCKYKNPGSDHCQKSPGEYLTKEAMSRVVARYIERVGMEFETPQALKEYLKKHPNADESKHTVKKHEEKEHEDKPKKSWKERLKGLSDGASKFIAAAPKAVRQFIEDDTFRRAALMGAHKALTEAPEKIVDRVKKTVKEEIHEFKAAGQGVAAVLKGGKMSKHQKEAFKTVSLHLAIGITAAALTATGPLSGAAVFAKGLARHVAAKSVSNALGHIHVLDELGHIGHGVKHLLEHVASDAQAQANDPEAMLARYIQAAKKGEDLDPEMVMTNFISACVAKELNRLTDDDVKEALNGMDKDEGDEKPEAKKAALVVARFFGQA